MMIKNLTLENFRVFQGVHEIDLEPKDSAHGSKPIILIGGLNGAGKTSILTAIRLALYGRNAFEGLHQNQDYIEKLESFVHNGSKAPEQPGYAAVTLTFTYNKNGEQSIFKVDRTWNRGEKDRLTLFQDGAILNELNYDQCQGFLNELIPHGIADLFFFDGEKIASLAEDESGRVLQTAVRRLLGLDLISKLRNDLAIFLKRQAAAASSIEHQNKLMELEQDGLRHGLSAENFRYAADLEKISLEIILNDIRKQEALLATQGGAFASSKATEQTRVDELIKARASSEKSIRHELEGALPFALAPNALRVLLKQLETESDLKKRSIFTSEFNAFINTLNKNSELSALPSKSSLMATIDKEFKKYVGTSSNDQIILDISERELGILEKAINSEAVISYARFDKARSDLEQSERELEQASSNIERAPDDEQLMDAIQHIRDLDKKYQAVLTGYKALLEKARKALLDQLDCAKKLQKLHDKGRTEHSSNGATENANRTLALLDEYGVELTRARVQKLEKMFAEAYRRLARKDDLRITARINASTFDVELIDDGGSVINRRSLSAGEQQIYAIAILDALAKTSGRQLPVIIDTPLGRLDSRHRENLIENYFPSASHQVVLLSTDTEINERYYIDQLSKYTSHSYQISFDGATKSAQLNPGYFWSRDNGEVFYNATQ
ncbi:DNA sulfur modification protein DndD [Pseudomonas fluorescens]|uniref:DNA sulfur modification protein DndD n=1 Tax=Pseudomonas fluorescens TaxID=294 RepID=A0A423M8H9_PSEFL|nr:DNA sulfur modification protein DndD [Pseudomonas fluorescens]RON79121.1 DNA sulfur modification protein DndD [Pseudomonas fluorescens]